MATCMDTLYAMPLLWWIINEDNWTWFLCLLLKAIDNVDDPYIISNWKNGLIATMQEVFLHEQHGHYICSSFKGECED